MKIHGSAEYARMMTLQRQTIETRDRLDAVAKELTTNLKSNAFEATGGNLARLFSLERMLDRNAIFHETLDLTELRVDIMQESLGHVLTWAEELSVDLLTTTGAGDVATAFLHARTAERAFADTVSKLNTTVGGQSVFAGIATDGRALDAAETILADLDALVAGAPDAATAEVLIEDYFREAPPGAFLTTRYLGSTQDLAAAEIGEGIRLDYALRADRGELVEVLKGHAMAAVVARGSFAAPVAEQMALLNSSGTLLLAAKEGMLDLRAEVGISQQAIETARAQRQSEKETYNLARTNIVAVDPYAAASAFQALQTQLQSVFEVTARLSTLRFSNFMR